MQLRNKPSVLYWPILGLAILAASLQFGDSLHRRAEAGVRGSDKKEQRHFKSGGERSEAILVEIAATLKRIDERLARIESAATKNAKLQNNNTRGNRSSR